MPQEKLHRLPSPMPVPPHAPRQHAAKVKEEPIIDESGRTRRSRLRRLVEFILSVIGTVIMWIALAVFVYQRLFVEVDGRAVAMLGILGIITLVIVIVQGAWQLYNWLLYRGEDRRRAFPQQSLEVVGRLYGIGEQAMHIIRAPRQLTSVRYADGRYYFITNGHPPIEITALRGH